VRNGSYEFGELVLSSGGKVGHLFVTRYLLSLLLLLSPEFPFYFIFYFSKLGSLEGGGDFGLVLKNTEFVQLLKNKKLRNVHHAADVKAENQYAGVDLQKWKQNQRIQLRSTMINRKLFVHGNISAPSVRVSKRLLQEETNDLLPLLATIAARHASTLPSNCHLVFHNLKVKIFNK
jgi:hypothetical protein